MEIFWYSPRRETCIYLVLLNMYGKSLKGSVDLLVLAVCAQAPFHGYAVIQFLRERSSGIFDLPEGTVYPALHRLERARLLKSHRDDASGRPRRVYTLTSSGRTALKSQTDDWHVFSRAIDRILRISL
jgi:PadR family transcriptional regulator, regulatory protein PadR